MAERNGIRYAPYVSCVYIAASALNISSVRFSAVQRIERHSHAKADDQPVRIYRKGRIYRMYQRAGGRSRFVRRADFASSNKIRRRQSAPGKTARSAVVQTMRDCCTAQFIADIMTISVINGFKAIQIHKQMARKTSLPDSLCWIPVPDDPASTRLCGNG